MHLKILLPYQIFADRHHINQIVAQTLNGSYGLLPHRLDCVAALSAGILEFTSATGTEYVAVDEGVLVKTGSEVLVSVRNAIGGTDLGQLHQIVEQQFLNLDEQEKNVRRVMAKLESGFIQRFSAFHHA